MARRLPFAEMRLVAGILVIGAASVLGGCGASEQDQVKAKVEQLTDAAKDHNYAAICNQILAPALVNRLAGTGVSCQYVMQIAMGSAQNRPISVGRVTIKGATAQVITLTAAKGQQSGVNAIELVKTSSGWRITSLNSPVAGT